MKHIISFIFIFLWTLPIKADTFFQDYCIGYLEEVYWVLDPIEEEEVRDEIINFFNEKFPQSKSLNFNLYYSCLLYTSPSPRDVEESRMPSSA